MSHLGRAAVLVALVAVSLSACSKERKESISLTNKGVRALQRHDARVAYDYFSKAAQVDPSNEVAHYHLGLVLYHDIGDHAAARKSFERALELDGGDIEALYQLGRLDYETGRPNDAEKRLRAVLDASPEHAGAYYFLGKIAEKQGDLVAADGAYRKAVTLDPGHEAAFHALGSLYEEVGAVEEAVQVYREAIRLNPEDTENRNSLGVILLHQGRAHDAIDLFFAIAELQPSRRDVLFNLGDAFLLAGDDRKAIYYLNRYITGPEGPVDEPAPNEAAARIMVKNIERKLGFVTGEPRAEGQID